MKLQDLTEGSLLAGRYRLEERVATGGMGVVWRARDELLERTVAVKMLQDMLAAEPRAAERFRREALTAASISHPNMADVYDYIEDDGRPGIVMEFVDGDTLAERLARGLMPVEEAVRIADGLLAALDAAHNAGVIHRDVKPGNVLLTARGSVKVTDFGIARTATESALTATGQVMGTAHYTAPEQLRGELASACSDLYAVGLVLYEMLVGGRPFHGDTPAAVAMARLSEDPVPPRVHRPEIPPALESVVMRALARDPQDRFANATVMRQALRAAVPFTPGTSPIVLPSPPAPDGTSVMDSAPGEETVVLGAAAQPSVGPASSPVADSVPPRWAARRIALFLLPLALVALLVAGAVALVGGGPAIVDVPEFVGHSVTEARVLAREAGLELAVEEVPSRRAKGRVVRQDIAAGADVREGTTVRLEVSSGVAPCCTVPNLEGMRWRDGGREIKSKLEDAGLKVGEVRRVASSRAEGTVLDQNPPAGDRADRGDAVDITIAVRPSGDGGGRGKDDDKDGGGRGKGGGEKRDFIRGAGAAGGGRRNR